MQDFFTPCSGIPGMRSIFPFGVGLLTWQMRLVETVEERRTSASRLAVTSIAYIRRATGKDAVLKPILR